VLDLNELYTRRYHRRFGDRTEALRFLLERARLVVASRGASSRQEIAALLELEPREVAANILYLDLPSEIAERSATEVRDRVKRGQSIEGLVPPSVESYIAERGIYRNRETS
jgi:nicotinic acid mononucleotide adenylyltransferase